MHTAQTFQKLTITVTLLSLAACTSVARTNIHRRYPARPDSTAVLVYEQTDTMPDNAEFLGSLRITEDESPAGFSYEQAIQIAQIQTNRIGGNGLRIVGHKNPSQESGYQIAADMLLLSDSVYTTSRTGNITVLQSRITEQNSPVLDPKTDRPLKTPLGTRRNTLQLSAGYGTIVSKVYLPNGDTGNPPQGWALTAAYQWIPRRGPGFGIRYSGYFSSASSPYGPMRIGLHYVGAELVLLQEVGRRWVFREWIGFGYARYNERIGNLSGNIKGFGLHLGLTVEYKLTKYIGINLGVEDYYLRFTYLDNKLDEFSDNQKGGFVRIGLNGGLSFYF